MSGVPLESCWVSKNLWNNKFYYKAASCWYFYWALWQVFPPSTSVLPPSSVTFNQNPVFIFHSSYSNAMILRNWESLYTTNSPNIVPETDACLRSYILWILSPSSAGDSWDLWNKFQYQFQYQAYTVIDQNAYIDAWKKYHKTACTSLPEDEHLDVRNMSKTL